MWTSKTRQFGFDEMRIIEGMTAENLAGSLLVSDPIVALRAMAEVMLNGDEEKLGQLLKNEQLTAHWRRVVQVLPETSVDAGYAQQLEAKILELQQKGE